MGEEPTGLILQALHFAARKHRDQRRKDQEASPYINHPIALAHLLWNEAGVRDAAVISAALLHDTVEDTDTSFAELAEQFGPEIEQLVREVSDDKTLSREERRQLQIDHAPSLSQGARLIKLADKISNLRDIVNSPPYNWSVQRRRDYFYWAKSVIDRIRGSHPKLEDSFDEIYRQGIEQLQD